MGVEASALRGRLLRDALERRLDEVRVRLHQTSGPRRHEPSAALADDPEEALRIFMVRLWPRVVRGAPGPDDRASFDEYLRALSEAARGDDLRFLDAWNNAYEALGDRAEVDFLREYSELLACQVRRLALQ